MSGRITVFVYFKVDAAADDIALRSAFARLAQRVAPAGAQLQVMQRIDDRVAPVSAAPSTWMEIYRIEPAIDRAARSDWLARLDVLARECGVSAFAAGGRHVEVFEDRTDG